MSALCSLIRWAVLALSLCSLVACTEKTVALSILTYNHADIGYYDVEVNGAMAPWGYPLQPGEKFSGGGGTTCCIVLPATWRPGLKAHVAWKYTRLDEDTRPIPPPHEADVEIPEYHRDPESGRIGRFFIHFYPDHQVRVVVHRVEPGYPGSPDPDLAPPATGRPLPAAQP